MTKPARRPDCYFTTYIDDDAPHALWLVDEPGGTFWVEPPYVVDGVTHHTVGFASSQWRQHLVRAEEGWKLTTPHVKAWAMFGPDLRAYDGSLSAEPPSGAVVEELVLAPWRAAGLGVGEALSAAMSRSVPLGDDVELAVELIPGEDHVTVVPLGRDGRTWARSIDAATVASRPTVVDAVTRALAGEVDRASSAFPRVLFEELLAAPRSLAVVRARDGWRLLPVTNAPPLLSPALNPVSTAVGAPLAALPAGAEPAEVANRAVAELNRLVG